MYIYLRARQLGPCWDKYTCTTPIDIKTGIVLKSSFKRYTYEYFYLLVILKNGMVYNVCNVAEWFYYIFLKMIGRFFSFFSQND